MDRMEWFILIQEGIGKNVVDLSLSVNTASRFSYQLAGGPPVAKDL